MPTFLVARVDGDTYAVAHRGDHRAAIAAALELSLAPTGAAVHVALVDASDAGAAGLAPVAYWIGTDDTDDTVREIARSMDLDPDEMDVATMVALALILADEIAVFEVRA